MISGYNRSDFACQQIGWCSYTECYKIVGYRKKTHRGLNSHHKMLILEVKER